MITLSDVRDWIKNYNASNFLYVGKLDNKQDYSIGVYQRGTTQAVRAIGAQSSYDIKQISILIHWNKNAKDTEKRAMYLYNQILNSENVIIGNHHVYVIRLLHNEPIDVGTDDNGVYERVIELDLFFERIEIESEE